MFTSTWQVWHIWLTAFLKIKIVILPQFLTSHVHFVRKGCDGPSKIAILPQFLTSKVYFVRQGCVSWQSGGTAPALRERWKEEREKIWRCEDVDLQVWRCEDVDLQMWGCEDVDQQIWRCEDVDQQVWGWRCRSADVRVKIYYNGCFFTKNLSQALSGKKEDRSLKNKSCSLTKIKTGSFKIKNYSLTKIRTTRTH